MRRMTHSLIRYVTAPDEGGGTGEAPAIPDPTKGEAHTDATGTDTTSSDHEDPAPQEEWDAKRALDKIRKANAEAKAQRERAKAAEEKVAGLEEVTRERDALAKQVLQMRIAAEFGLKPSLAARLNGATEEEMRADAQSLLEDFTPAGPPSQTPRPAAPTGGMSAPAPKEPSLEEIGARMFRR